MALDRQPHHRPVPAMRRRPPPLPPVQLLVVLTFFLEPRLSREFLLLSRAEAEQLHGAAVQALRLPLQVHARADASLGCARTAVPPFPPLLCAVHRRDAS